MGKERGKGMNCGRCGGSVIDAWDQDPKGITSVPKCISCGHEQPEGGDMGEESGIRIQESERTRTCRRCLQVKKIAAFRGRGSSGRHDWVCRECSPEKNSAAAKKAWKTRKRTARRAIPTTAAPGKSAKEMVPVSAGEKPSFFLSAEGIFAPAQEVRIELVYQLTGVKIIKE